MVGSDTDPSFHLIPVDYFTDLERQSNEAFSIQLEFQMRKANFLFRLNDIFTVSDNAASVRIINFFLSFFVFWIRFSSEREFMLVIDVRCTDVSKKQMMAVSR
jgi:hypothetical protein